MDLWFYLVKLEIFKSSLKIVENLMGPNVTKLPTLLKVFMSKNLNQLKEKFCLKTQ